MPPRGGGEGAPGEVERPGGQRVEFLGELLAVGLDFLFLAFLRACERLVELLLKARLADHDQRGLAGAEIVAELLGIAA